ncbi:type II toxin-antitoxin system YafO family toxin [Photorhabdus tasmaniensis]|uniref:type II toxin-antitoxin system YafO family toxin n=1 Tax=Photorhabdus tasmaniensis TaxID=1004159 RepID=UPI0040416114
MLRHYQRPRTFHIKAPGEGFWSSDIRQSVHTSNNYLVYARHWEQSDIFQSIAVIAPDAHEKIDAMLPVIIEITENDFQSLNQS